jgi:hypothetical protein
MNESVFENETVATETPAAKPNGKAHGVTTKQQSKYASVGADSMRKAKKGGVSKSRTGKAPPALSAATPSHRTTRKSHLDDFEVSPVLLRQRKR